MFPFQLIHLSGTKSSDSNWNRETGCEQKFCNLLQPKEQHIIF